MNNAIAILGIHTGIGKTVASAVIAEAIGADYWKPVQAGLEERDAALVKALLANGEQRVYDEAVLLTEPMSPHAAAKIDNITVDYTKFNWPATEKQLLVETAGGILSPMTATATMADFVQHYNLPAILVTQNYLGSINHTLMSIEVLQKRGIDILALVVNGKPDEQSESFIEQYTKVKVAARIPYLDMLDKKSVSLAANEIAESLSFLRNRR